MHYMDAKSTREKLDGNFIRMICAVLKKILEVTPVPATEQPLTSHRKTIQVRRTRHARHCRRSKDDIICYILQWSPTPSNDIHRLYKDTVWGSENLLRPLDIRDGWGKRERERDRGGEREYCCIHIYTGYIPTQW